MVYGNSLMLKESSSSDKAVFFWQVFPLRGLHEAALAKIADLLLQSKIAVQCARKAISILTVTKPESSYLNDLFQIEHNILARG